MQTLYTYISTIGEGAYGDVWRCLERDTRRVVAIKVLKQAHTCRALMRLAEREIMVLRGLDHPNIVRLLAVHQTKSGRVHLVFEFVPTSMQVFLNSWYPQGLPLAALKVAAWQLIRAVAHLHDRRVMHRDIKPANILVDDCGLLKLCDFGFARTSAGGPLGMEECTSYTVTRWYRAPEIILGDLYGPSSDVWSMGCTIAELAMGGPLFPGSSSLDQLWRIVRCLGPLPPRQAALLESSPQLRGCPPMPDRPTRPLRERLPCPDPRLLQLLEACLRLDPRQRLTARQLLLLPFFEDVPRVLAGTRLGTILADTGSGSNSNAGHTHPGSAQPSPPAGGQPAATLRQAAPPDAQTGASAVPAVRVSPRAAAKIMASVQGRDVGAVGAGTRRTVPGSPQAVKPTAATQPPAPPHPVSKQPPRSAHSQLLSPQAQHPIVADQGAGRQAPFRDPRGRGEEVGRAVKPPQACQVAVGGRCESEPGAGFITRSFDQARSPQSTAHGALLESCGDDLTSPGSSTWASTGGVPDKPTSSCTSSCPPTAAPTLCATGGASAAAAAAAVAVASVVPTVAPGSSTSAEVCSMRALSYHGVGKVQLRRFALMNKAALSTAPPMLDLRELAALAPPGQAAATSAQGRLKRPNTDGLATVREATPAVVDSWGSSAAGGTEAPILTTTAKVEPEALSESCRSPATHRADILCTATRRAGSEPQVDFSRELTSQKGQRVDPKAALQGQGIFIVDPTGDLVERFLGGGGSIASAGAVHSGCKDAGTGVKGGDRRDAWAPATGDSDSALSELGLEGTQSQGTGRADAGGVGPPHGQLRNALKHFEAAVQVGAGTPSALAAPQASSAARGTRQEGHRDIRDTALERLLRSLPVLHRQQIESDITRSMRLRWEWEPHTQMQQRSQPRPQPHCHHHHHHLHDHPLDTEPCGSPPTNFLLSTTQAVSSGLLLVRVPQANAAQPSPASLQRAAAAAPAPPELFFVQELPLDSSASEASPQRTGALAPTNSASLQRRNRRPCGGEVPCLGARYPGSTDGTGSLYVRSSGGGGGQGRSCVKGGAESATGATAAGASGSAGDALSALKAAGIAVHVCQEGPVTPETQGIAGALALASTTTAGAGGAAADGVQRTRRGHHCARLAWPMPAQSLSGLLHSQSGPVVRRDCSSSGDDQLAKTARHEFVADEPKTLRSSDEQEALAGSARSCRLGSMQLWKRCESAGGADFGGCAAAAAAATAGGSRGFPASRRLGFIPAKLTLDAAFEQSNGLVSTGICDDGATTEGTGAVGGSHAPVISAHLVRRAAAAAVATTAATYAMKCPHGSRGDLMVGGDPPGATLSFIRTCPPLTTNLSAELHAASAGALEDGGGKSLLGGWVRRFRRALAELSCGLPGVGKAACGGYRRRRGLRRDTGPAYS